METMGIMYKKYKKMHHHHCQCMFCLLCTACRKLTLENEEYQKHKISNWKIDFLIVNNLIIDWEQHFWIWRNSIYKMSMKVKCLRQGAAAKVFLIPDHFLPRYDDVCRYWCECEDHTSTKISWWLDYVDMMGLWLSAIDACLRNICLLPMHGV